MDWSNVSLAELIDELQTVDWGKPRSPADFLGRTSLPRDGPKWVARLKANVFYYRANYLLLCAGAYALCFLRNPLALSGVILATLAVLCVNNTFAIMLNDHALRIVRRIHAPTALRIRAKTAHSSPPLATVSAMPRKRAGNQKVFILAMPRTLFVALSLLIAGLLLRISAAWRTLAWGTLFGVGLPLLHATVRSPNLKAKLASAREEFKAMWRGYQMEMNAAGAGNGPGVFPAPSFATAGLAGNTAYPDYTR